VTYPKVVHEAFKYVKVCNHAALQRVFAQTSSVYRLKFHIPQKQLLALFSADIIFPKHIARLH